MCYYYQGALNNNRSTMKDQKQSIDITLKGNIIIHGYLEIPPNASGLVLFVHGSGSGRNSPRNQFVASTLNQYGLATLLMDLLTEEEEEVDLVTRHLRFDIHFLSERVSEITNWLKKNNQTRNLFVGYFGSSTGAAAALVAAAERGDEVKSVVSRGGRPDLAANALHRVTAPTLLIVGGDDYGVIELNQNAYQQISAKKSLEIVPHATHLFEEPGTLEQVAKLAAEWFKTHLR